MKHSLNCLLLTGSAAAPALDQSVIATVRALIEPGAVLQERWLGQGVAWQALLPGRGPGEDQALRARLTAALAARPIDVNLIEAADQHRRKKLLVADMESTIIEQECLDELAAFAGVQARISDITARAMRGELAFEAALSERVLLLKGLDVASLEEVYARRVTLTAGAETLVATMRRHGAHCALVSGGFSFFSERIAERLGFDSQQANMLEIADGKLAGKVRAPILGREAKLAALEKLRQDLGLQPEETLAVGDGANDLAMLAAAGLGVAFRAKPILAAAAAARIDHGDLSCLLYLQGYSREEFA
jgi:phosphoserine phosphatase